MTRSPLRRSRPGTQKREHLEAEADGVATSVARRDSPAAGPGYASAAARRVMVGSDRPRRMSAILLALGSALSYGAADFIAGWLSRRDHYARVALLTQLAAASGTVLVSVLVGGRPSTASLVWGAGCRASGAGWGRSRSTGGWPAGG